MEGIRSNEYVHFLALVVFINNQQISKSNHPILIRVARSRLVGTLISGVFLIIVDGLEGRPLGGSSRVFSGVLICRHHPGGGGCLVRGAGSHGGAGSNGAHGGSDESKDKDIGLKRSEMSSSSTDTGSQESI